MVMAVVHMLEGVGWCLKVGTLPVARAAVTPVGASRAVHASILL